jgi:hypothetical protein
VSPAPSLVTDQAGTAERHSQINYRIRSLLHCGALAL